MMIELEFFGPVRRPWPESKQTLTIAGGKSIADLLADCGFRPDELRFLWVTINGERARAAQLLDDGDKVVVALMIGGG